MSFEEAVKETNNALSDFIESTPLYLDMLVEKRRVEVNTFTKFNEYDISRSRDLQEMGWYTGVPVTNGVWNGLVGRMEAKGLGDAIGSIDQSSDLIVSSLAEPRVNKMKRLGIVIGNVQSGKTANYTAVIAKALDCQYKFVIVLSGIHNNLRKQTQRRLERDLGATVNPAEWLKLTGEEGDFGRAYIENAAALVNSHQRVLAVAKKNTSRLKNLLEFLQEIPDVLRSRIPILIIDDESDQATPDSSPGIDDDPTAVNQLMKEIWAEVRNGSYVGYTATPFANILMNPNAQDANGLQELYPKDFIHVMPTPSEYFGAEKIFGVDEDAGRDINHPDVVRKIPQSEVDVIVANDRMKTSAKQTVTHSLEDAIRWFVVAAAIRRSRSQSDQHSTMLVHTTHYADPHFAMRDAIVKFLEPLKRRAREDDVEAFREIFHAERDRAAHLYRGGDSAPSWGSVSAEIPTVLWKLKVVVDNSRAKEEERLYYDDDDPQSVIVVGGGTLSRGLTLEGLFVSYFCRSSKTYDTLLQMGRWFGFRVGYEDLQRIWMSPGLATDYQFLASVEAGLRTDIARMTRLKRTPEMIGVRVRQHPGRLQIVSRPKMKHAEEIEIDYEEERLQTTNFDVTDADKLIRNADTAVRLIDQLAEQGYQGPGDIFSNVPVEELEEFFSTFEVHERFSETFEELYKWSSRKLPGQLWSVAVATGRGGEHLIAGGRRYRSVQRAPLNPDAPEAVRGEANIRALMSSEDIVLDIKHTDAYRQTKEKSDKSQLTHRDQFLLRRQAEGAQGHGLLVIYPISRFSKPDTKSENLRVPMDQVLSGLDEKHIAPGLPPIIGIAVIAPTDFEQTLKYDEKGTYVAVKPRYEGVDEYDESDVIDDEADFDGEIA